ncbi:MAG: hypothetical protein NTX28_09345 [Novosphingobium sp.]|nr:hypothetical protein [Novosphingobium sp.]
MNEMDALAALADKLAKHPELNWSKGDQWVSIAAPRSGGFAVELRRDGDEWTVFLGSGGWHQHFDEATEALDLVAWCFSGNARVREIYRGQVLQKSILEGLEDGSWTSLALTRYFAPFWRKKSEVVLRNPNLLSAKLD